MNICEYQSFITDIIIINEIFNMIKILIARI